jgi:hypothetical protein
MRMRFFLFGFAALTMACSSSTPAPSATNDVSALAVGAEEGYTAVADVRELMASVIDPSTDVIWDAVGTIITVAGTEERMPKNDEEWAAVRRAAFVVAESGNLLLMPGRVPDDPDWVKMSKALIEVGSRAIKAADAKDKEALFAAGGEIYVVCSACHEKFMIGQQ